MKGVIWTIAPNVQIADISHAIRPQDVIQGALALARTAPYFPAGTIHVAVVDPGVGTQRRPLAMQLGEQYFVGPDNGLFSAVLARAKEQGHKITIVHLDQSQYWLPTVSRVFHGRDIFAPTAAHLARGVAL
jgi:S-adenosylmethionine hydrolase